MFKRKDKRIALLEKELRAIAKAEERLLAQGERPQAQWRQKLEAKVPAKAFDGLEAAFNKGFALVFEKGGTLIEKTYRRQDLETEHLIKDYGVRVNGGRKELRKLDKSAARAGGANMALTTLTGLGLGALGIGLPDIVLFLGTLLRGIYQCALSYGYDYEDPWERLLILKLMAAPLSKGQDRLDLEAEVEAMIQAGKGQASSDQIQQQIRSTSSVFALDMLALKFIQGLPVVGLIGGAANGPYYHKVMSYVRLKYKKRYLLSKYKQIDL